MKEGTVEGVSIGEHASHVLELAGIPPRQILIEEAAEREHEPHGNHLGYIPVAYIFVEVVASIKEKRHFHGSVDPPSGGGPSQYTQNLHYLFCHLSGIETVILQIFDLVILMHKLVEGKRKVPNTVQVAVVLNESFFDAVQQSLLRNFFLVVNLEKLPVHPVVVIQF